MNQIGYGILTWDRGERVTARYGAIFLGRKDYKEAVSCAAMVDTDNLRVLEGKRVRLKAVVVEARNSGHCGDFFLNIMPSKPEVGEEVEIGVGVLGLDPCSESPGPAMSLQPEDGREHLWIDPRKLYRLHDQTIRLYIEETSDACHPAPDIDLGPEEGCVSTGDGLQFRGKRTPLKVAPKPISLGDGLYHLSAPDTQPAGTPVEVLQYKDSDS